jgi:Kef-type K+ transport system membrane component KefB
VLITYVLFNVLLIVVLARLLGNLMAAAGQPRVVGEIVAGILLGPTLLGESLSLLIAPAEVRSVLNVIAVFGLILFMFLAGVEYDPAAVRGRTKQAGILAFLAVLFPVLLGFPVARLIYTADFAGPAAASFVAFALFIGAALSVTAFPVMAHILMERGELNSDIGSLAVAATGIMSVLMFSFIAFAAAVASAGGFGGLMLKLVWMALFGLASLLVTRPLLERFFAPQGQADVLSGNELAVAFGGMVLYALVAHAIGINALVGAFFWGLLLPNRRPFRQAIAGRVRDVAMVVFLPVFFAMAGFAADLKLLTPETLPVVLLVLLAAVAGKFLSALAACTFGYSWSQAGFLGALFNTRGLLVLVVGLIGLDMHIITPLTFTVLVVVALATNLMTLPLLNLFATERTPVSQLKHTDS